MISDDPILSVVMPVYNGEKYLAEAIDSVLQQTFKNYELVIINDGSSDGSDGIIKNFADERIRYMTNEGNKGVAYTRNRGLQIANGKYLAWMDCDDLIHPQRFEKQVAFMENHPEFGLCGTWLERFNKKRTGTFKAPSDPEVISGTLLFKPSIPNATAMLRMSKIRDHKLFYNEALPIAEDYDFVFRCSKHMRMTNLKEILYSYRDSETSIMKKFGSEESKSFNIHKIVYKETLKYIGVEASESNLYLHWSIASEKRISDIIEYKKCFDWLIALRETNKKTKVYDQVAFRKVLAQLFYFLSTKSAKIGSPVLRFYLQRSISDFGFPSIDKITKLTARCLMRYDTI